jgi:hypothetical protein
MQTEIRNIYPGECVFLNDVVVLRAQTFGASSTLNSEDVHELGNFEIVEVVDNVPSVAVTLDTYCHGTIDTAALIAAKDPAATRFVRAADFEKASVDIYAPIIKGVDYGKTNADVAAGNLDIFRTIYVEDAFVNNLTLTFNTTAIGTENWALESDNKSWFFNEGASVVHAKATVPALTGLAAGDTVAMKLDGAVAGIAAVATESVVANAILDSGLAISANTGATALNDGTYTLGRNLENRKIVRILDSAGVLKAELTYDGTVAHAATVATGLVTDGKFKVMISAGNFGGTGKKSGEAILVPFAAVVAGDVIEVRYIAKEGGAYFTPNPDEIAGMRLGQVEIYLYPTLVDANGERKIDMTAQDFRLRVQSSTVTVSLAREQLLELGHFRPYARPLTFPIPVTVAVESIDADVRMFASLSGIALDSNQDSGVALAKTEVALEDLLKDLNLVIKTYRYSDVERKKIYGEIVASSGNTSGYIVSSGSYDEATSTLPAYGGAGADVAVTINGKSYYPHDLAPSKIITVKKLIPTGENQSLSVGQNGTQTFDFRADNMAQGVGGGATNVSSLTAVSFTHNNVAAVMWKAFKWGIVHVNDTSDI